MEKGRSDCNNEPKGCKPIRDAEKEKSPGFCQIPTYCKARANQFGSRGIPNPALEINSKNSQKQIHWDRFETLRASTVLFAHAADFFGNSGTGTELDLGMV